MPGEGLRHSSSIMPRQPSIRLQAQEFIERAVREGLSANETLNSLRAFGFGYRKQDFLEDYNRIAERQKKEDSWKYTPTKYAPPAESFEKVDFVLSTPYVYHFRVRGIDHLTGESFDIRLSVGELNKVSIAEARRHLQEKIAETMAEGEGESRDWEIENIVYEFAWERGEEE